MTELGHPITRIELTETHLIQSIHTALSHYYETRDGSTDLQTTELTLDGNNEAVLPPEIDPSLIRDIFFTESSNAFGFTNPIDEGVVATYPLSSFLNTNGGIFDLGQYYMARQNIQDANIITGRQKTWNIYNGKIKVLPQKIGGEYKNIMVLHGKLLTPDDIENDSWIRAYAVAYAKKMLGGIRAKFSGFSAAGGAATSDGSELKQEGQAEMDALRTKAKEDLPGLSMFKF